MSLIIQNNCQISERIVWLTRLAPQHNYRDTFSPYILFLLVGYIRIEYEIQLWLPLTVFIMKASIIDSFKMSHLCL